VGGIGAWPKRGWIRLREKPVAKRRKELFITKPQAGIEMVKRFIRYSCIDIDMLLTDSWFFSLGLLLAVRSFKNGRVHIISGLKRGKRKFVYNNLELTLSEIMDRIKASGQRFVRCRSLGFNYHAINVTLPDYNGPLKIIACKYGNNGKWRFFITSDASRWSIEVVFHELKQLMGFGDAKARILTAKSLIAQYAACFTC
jgi:hypothetical protein